MQKHLSEWKAAFAVAGCSLVLLAGCGGGSNGNVSAESLKPRLVPASVTPGYHVQRTFDWSDPVNLVGEGLYLPAAVHPSDAVKVFQDANLKGAAGEYLARGTPPDEDIIRSGVAKFDTASEANAIRDWMHARDLQEPCYGACVYSPKAIPVPGVPTAAAVEQAPNPALASKDPAAASHYSVVFTVGPYLHWVNLDAPHSAAAQVVAGVQKYYKGLAGLPS